MSIPYIIKSYRHIPTQNINPLFFEQQDDTKDNLDYVMECFLSNDDIVLLYRMYNDDDDTVYYYINEQAGKVYLPAGMIIAARQYIQSQYPIVPPADDILLLISFGHSRQSMKTFNNGTHRVETGHGFSVMLDDCVIDVFIDAEDQYSVILQKETMPLPEPVVSVYQMLEQNAGILQKCIHEMSYERRATYITIGNFMKVLNNPLLGIMDYNLVEMCDSCHTVDNEMEEMEEVTIWSIES